MNGSTHTDARLSDLEQFNQALLYRAAEQMSLAVRTGRTVAEFSAHVAGEVLTFVASLNADPATAMFCICVHEKRSARIVCRSDEMPFDAVRREPCPFEPWFEPLLDDSNCLTQSGCKKAQYS